MKIEAEDLPSDHIDRLTAQWAKELPDVDTEGMTIIGRARRITLHLRPAIEAVFARHGLDAGEFDVLSTLRRSGPPFRLTPTELYRTLMISSGGLTDRLSRLEAAGLVRRRPAETDRRSLLVELTELGRERAEAALREDMALERKLIGALSDVERRQLAGLLRKLALSLSAEAGGTGADK
ncbi:MarR family winged helix-turn-helix transcriptional regulator [Microvirga alba]|uniref:MarR family transcriptional regulator n=1 Tax=Microvirga alba TaxID=2791025 RepID=A0A931FR54_9HYPH|nr:MarR family transcriptional regulator [Microvirga alba]MBF9232416.1 MarR family transcriptional regulator [Microvirga alba]